MCSGQPKYTIEQIKDHFPSLLQNIMKINIQMKPAEGTNFEVSNFVWSIQQFFRMCKTHDKEFRILPWNIENQDDSTIKSSSITDYKQIPTQREAFEEYGYNIHVSINKLSLTMVISTSYSTFERMFKESSKRNGEKYSILRQIRDRNIWVTKNDLSTMGTTKFVGFLSYAHPYLTNQYKLLKELRKITNIQDLTVEHYNPKIFKKAARNEKATLLCSTVAYCIGAPADISVDVMQMIVEKWQAVRKGEYADMLGPTSNIHKFLFIPMSKVLMSDETRAEHMRKNNTFRFSYNGISLNKTRSIDVPFTISKEECREIGFDEKSSEKEVTIRMIINSWISSEDERPMVWMVEPVNDQRQVLVIKEQAVEAVRREASALYKLLQKRPDFQKIVGNIGAHVDGYQAHSPEAREYMEVLQETLVCVDSKRKEEYPALPPKEKSNYQRQRKKRMFNPYATGKFVQSAQYADVVQVQQKKVQEKKDIHRESDSGSEKTQAISTVSSLTNSIEKNNKGKEQVLHPKQLQKTARGNDTIIQSTEMVKSPIIQEPNTSEELTTSTTYSSTSSKVDTYTDREQFFINHIQEQDRRLKALESKQQETITTLQTAHRQYDEKIEKTIKAKLQPQNEKLESISESINNMKTKAEENQSTMSKMDERFDQLDNRLDRMLNIYEKMTQLQIPQSVSYKRIENENNVSTEVTQSQETEVESQPSNEENKQKKEHQQETKQKSQDTWKITATETTQRKNDTTLQEQWSTGASPQPKHTPNKKFENIRENKTIQSEQSPTTDEKGLERGEKRQKTPQHKKRERIATTTKIKQEMIDDATTKRNSETRYSNSKETSIEIDEENEWTTMGKNNTPRKKEEMRRQKKSAKTSPVTTRSSNRTTTITDGYRNEQGMTIMKTRKATQRTKSPNNKKTAATLPKTYPEILKTQRGDKRKGEVGLRGRQ